VHKAMAARTADVRWEHQHGAPQRPQQEPLQRVETSVAAEDPALQAQLLEARERLRRRYERETGGKPSECMKSLSADC
jgi:hypothetical protein